MFTRGHVSHDYTEHTPAPVSMPSVMALRQVGASNTPGKNVTAVVPISRPVSAPSPDCGAPFYSAESYNNPSVRFIYGGRMALHLPRNGVEADITDPNTWQREYRFDG